MFEVVSVITSIEGSLAKVLIISSSISLGSLVPIKINDGVNPGQNFFLKIGSVVVFPFHTRLGYCLPEDQTEGKPH